MAVYRLDPLTDARWDSFLKKHPQASVFHSPNWLRALAGTYGYVPIVFTTSPPETDLRNGIACCVVRNWFGGCRLVSLPFSDHCVPLVQDAETLTTLLDYLQGCVSQSEWNHVEIRMPDSSLLQHREFKADKTFVAHKLSLSPSVDQLFNAFHKDCVQRKIVRAVREGLAHEVGVSDSLLKKFYTLLLLTRRRHGLPPQPVAWFRNLRACLGDEVKIHVASKDGRPIASILTLRFKQTLVYKYGCSDYEFSNLGGIQLLLWKSIQEAKASDLDEVDMGRSDSANTGLIRFKDRWGAARLQMIYERYPSRNSSHWEVGLSRLGKSIFPYVPDRLLAMSGRLLYKHIG
jgi:lipid II:glycine glycyltransferase (peptidoglycan interpeptide bridge formation enzyme)